ncbi:penicillin-binding protein activator [Desulfonema magnum]|uniref:Leucine-binding domain-containing protein n=1 Tax=Desulfonema magnum TaxID=45655 RepID=A0A975BT63_9BACT|nr:penicillin-binding protein activator [Desulfonema magnum]QTA91007.1 Leucine-binding domain-containing protein [Desulfonema magnum]
MKPSYKMIILFGIFFVCACGSVTEMVPETPVSVDSETELFYSAERMFRLKSYDEALTLYDEYLFKFPDGYSAPAALMRQGAIHTGLGNYKTARRVYTSLIHRYPNSPLVQDARVEALVTFYNAGQYKQVIIQAPDVLKKVVSKAHILKIYVLLGDAYIAVGDTINAVNFYSSAHRHSAYPEKENVAVRLKQAMGQLSTSDIIFLLERLENNVTRGYLMYHLGLKHMNEERTEDAVSVFSEFIERFPDHKNVEDAKRLLTKLDTIPEYDYQSIGCMLPLSGSYKIYGNRALKGIELAKNQAGFSINIIIKDTKSDPNEAVRAVKELSQERVSAIIGPIITAEAAATEAQKRKIPIITLTQKEGITNIGNHVFRNFLTPKMQVKAIVAYAMNNLGLHNFGILYPDEKYGTTFMSLFWDEVASHGGQVVGIESYRPTQTDFGGPIRNLIRQSHKKGRYADPDAIFIPDAPAKAGLIIPQLAFYNVYNVRLFGTNLWHSEKLIRMARKSVQGAVIPDVFFAKSYSQNVRDFVRDFQRSFGKKPGFIEAIAYDTAMMLLRTINESDSPYRRTLKDEMTRIQNFRGVTGLTSFDNTGEAHKQLYLLRIEGNKFVELETY